MGHHLNRARELSDVGVGTREGSGHRTSPAVRSACAVVLTTGLSCVAGHTGQNQAWDKSIRVRS